jgi:hypothetical protein
MGRTAEKQVVCGHFSGKQAPFTTEDTKSHRGINLCVPLCPL